MFHCYLSNHICNSYATNHNKLSFHPHLYSLINYFWFQILRHVRLYVSKYTSRSNWVRQPRIIIQVFYSHTKWQTLSTIHFFLVSCKVPRLTERFTTYITRVRLVAGVYSLVFDVRRGIRKLFVAYRTLERFFSRVQSSMRHKCCPLSKMFATKFAFVLFLGAMCSRVSWKFLSGGKFLETNSARVFQWVSGTLVIQGSCRFIYAVNVACCWMCWMKILDAAIQTKIRFFKQEIIWNWRNRC